MCIYIHMYICNFKCHSFFFNFSPLISNAFIYFLLTCCKPNGSLSCGNKNESCLTGHSVLQFHCSQIFSQYA